MYPLYIGLQTCQALGGLTQSQDAPVPQQEGEGGDGKYVT